MHTDGVAAPAQQPSEIQRKVFSNERFTLSKSTLAADVGTDDLQLPSFCAADMQKHADMHAVCIGIVAA